MTKLTAAQALRAKNPAADRYSDGRNLYLTVSSTGAKSWLFIWLPKAGHPSFKLSKNGKPLQRELGLGSATGAGATLCVSLDAARLLADAVRAQIADGLCPFALKVVANVGVTFADMLAVTIKNNTPAWKTVDGVCKEAIDWNQKMSNHAAQLLPMAAALVTTDAVANVVAPIWHEHHVTALRVRYIIEQVMITAADQLKLTTVNPALLAVLKVRLGRVKKQKIKKQKSLHYSKVQAAIAALLADGRMGAKASAFCTLTATRTDEARLMKWSEVNLDRKEWIVPAIRMKVENDNDRGGDHWVPLSDAAIRILRSIQPVAGNPYVFAGEKAGQTVSATALNDMITKTRKRGGLLELKGQATQHGMRATFRTWGGRDNMKFDADALEMTLAHLVGESDTERSYERGEMEALRRSILQAWGEFAAPAVRLAAVA